MADVRLIDANVLAQRFSAMQECANMRDHVYLMGVLSVIDNSPTIDAVPVVRCRECKWCELLPISAYCVVWNSITRRNGFCYRGEKMDGGAENE